MYMYDNEPQNQRNHKSMRTNSLIKEARRSQKSDLLFLKNLTSLNTEVMKV